MHTEESQILYVYALSSWKGCKTFHRCRVLCFKLFVPKNKVWKAVKKSNLTLEKPDKHDLSQMFKVCFHTQKLCWYWVLWIWLMKTAFYFCGYFSHNSQHQSAHEKTPDSPNWTICYKIAYLYLSTRSRSSKTRKVGHTVTVETSLKRRDS